MKFLTKFVSAVFIAAFPIVPLAQGGCKVVDGDHLYAADLAELAPPFAALNPGLEIGLSPLPGIQRVFHPADLLRLARANGIAIQGNPPEVCFERRGNGIAGTAAPRTPAPLVVKHGDKVSVTVSAGGVELRFDAQADTAGHIGDTVIVSNPENGNRFSARVQDSGRVVVNR